MATAHAVMLMAVCRQPHVRAQVSSCDHGCNGEDAFPVAAALPREAPRPPLGPQCSPVQAWWSRRYWRRCLTARATRTPTHTTLVTKIGSAIPKSRHHAAGLPPSEPTLDGSAALALALPSPSRVGSYRSWG